MSLQIFFTLKPIFRHEQGSKPEINEVTISDISKDNGTDYESFTQEEAMLVLEAITTRTIEVI